jgi:L-ribulose-5-phosphate 3-epimerase
MRSMSIGILAHLCEKSTYDVLAEKVSSHGYDYVQLALWKAIEGYDFTRPGILSPGLANTIAEAFDKQGVKIPVLGCYIHLYSKDESTYQVNLKRFKEHLRHARHFGASVVAVETGKPEPGTTYEENWDRQLRAFQELTEEAEKWGGFIGVEPANGHLIDTPEKLVELWDAVPSPTIGALMDPCNLMTPDNFNYQDEVIHNAFRLVGERIVSLHAKDVKWGENGQLITTAPGSGQLNYPLYLELANQYKPLSYMTMEGLDQTQMSDAIQFINKTRNSAN